MRLATYLHVVLRLRMRGPAPLLHHMHPWHEQGKLLVLSIIITTFDNCYSRKLFQNV